MYMQDYNGKTITPTVVSLNKIYIYLNFLLTNYMIQPLKQYKKYDIV